VEWVVEWVEEWVVVKQAVEGVEAITALFIIPVNIHHNRIKIVNNTKDKNHNKEDLKIKETKFLMYSVEISIKMSNVNSDKLAEKNIHLCLMTKMA
jgi:hypothetical protein